MRHGSGDPITLEHEIEDMEHRHQVRTYLQLLALPYLTLWCLLNMDRLSSLSYIHYGGQVGQTHTGLRHCSI